MPRPKGSLNKTRFGCYVFDASHDAGPTINGKRYGRRIAYREFAQQAAALRWLNASPRCCLPRELVRRTYDPMSGFHMGSRAGIWYCNEQATI